MKRKKRIDPVPGLLRVSQEAIDRYGKGFRAGYNRLGPHQRVALRDTLLARGLNSRTFYQLLNGEIIPKVTVAAHIAEVFARFGIDDPWGDGTRHVTLHNPDKGEEGHE